MRVLYNEIDQFCCAWLSNLMDAGLIRPGVICNKSIADLTPEEVEPYDLVHYFAGVGGWDYALTLAGWTFAGRKTWTGSCPCQPFSVAGKQQGEKDPRHLWPEFKRLVAECKPPAVYGEQVASKAGRVWLAGVFADLEALGYAVAGADLCAAGVSAPHIRQRLFWMADGQRHTGDARRVADEPGESPGAPTAGPRDESGRCGVLGGLAHSDGQRQDGQHALLWPEQRTLSETPGSGSAVGRLEHDASGRRQGRRSELADGSGLGHHHHHHHHHHQGSQGRSEHTGEHAHKLTPWAASVFIPCLDGKWRRVPANEAGEPESALFPLAYGVSGRVGKLRGAGNAIVPQVAAEFIKAYLEIKNFA